MRLKRLKDNEDVFESCWISSNEVVSLKHCYETQVTKCWSEEIPRREMFLSCILLKEQE